MARQIIGKLYQDANAYPIQVIPGSGTRVNAATAGAGATAGAPLPAGTNRLLKVTATDYVWIDTGNAAVAATASNASILFAPGEGIIHVPVADTHFSILRVGATDVTVQLESIYTGS